MIVVSVVIFNMLRVEKNDGKQAGDQISNYLLLENYLL
jgi:hypothetical protein